MCGCFLNSTAVGLPYRRCSGGGALEREVNFPSDVRERHFHWPGEGLAL